MYLLTINKFFFTNFRQAQSVSFRRRNSSDVYLSIKCSFYLIPIQWWMNNKERRRKEGDLTYSNSKSIFWTELSIRSDLWYKSVSGDKYYVSNDKDSKPSKNTIKSVTRITFENFKFIHNYITIYLIKNQHFAIWCI